MDIFSLLRKAASSGASDLHLVVSSPPLLRVNGTLEAVDGAAPLNANEISQAFLQITTPEQRESFHHNLELDFTCRSSPASPCSPSALTRRRWKSSSVGWELPGSNTCRHPEIALDSSPG